MLFNWNLKLSIGEYQTTKKVTVWLHKGLYQEHAVDWKDNYIMGVNIINTKRVAWENDLSHTADFLKAHSNKTKSMKTEWPQVLDLKMNHKLYPDFVPLCSNTKESNEMENPK